MSSFFVLLLQAALALVLAVLLVQLLNYLLPSTASNPWRSSSIDLSNHSTGSSGSRPSIDHSFGDTEQPWWERTLPPTSQQQLDRQQQQDQQGEQEQHDQQEQQQVEQQAPAMSLPPSHCRVCRRETTTRCSKCKSTWYCSRECQRQDWERHQYECKRWQSSALAAASNSRVFPGPITANGGQKPAPPQPADSASCPPVPSRVLFPYDLFLRLFGGSDGCRRPPVGLTNCGNSCFASAVLQCLMATRPLRAFLDAQLHSGQCRRPTKSTWCLLCELQGLAHAGCHANPGAELSVRTLLRNIKKVSKSMSMGRQEDAHEFLYSLVVAMEGIQLAEAGGKERYDARSRETTLVHHIFNGYLRQQTSCTVCGSTSKRYEPFYDVQMEVPPGGGDLEGALAMHFSDEWLDGDNAYQCDTCAKLTRACKSVRMEVAPNCLVASLKRFGVGRFGKVNRRVGYSDTLDLEPYMAKGALDQGSSSGGYRYSLYAVIVHQDQMNSTMFGHYIAHVRSGDARWYCCDDESIMPVSLSKVLSHNAYMLFYVRDEPRAAPPAPLAQQQQEQQQQQQQQGKPANGNGLHAAFVPKAAGQLAEEQADEQQQQDQQRQQEVEKQHATTTAATTPAAAKVPSAVALHAVPDMLTRVATAPAALQHMGNGHAGPSSPSSAESAGVSDASSSAEGSVAGSGQTSPTGAAAARMTGSAAVVAGAQEGSDVGPSQQQPDGVGARIADAAAPGPENGNVGSSTAAHTQQHTQQGEQQGQQLRDEVQEHQHVYSDPSHTLPAIHFELRSLDADHLLLRAQLPGICSAADVQLEVRPGQLTLCVPGRYQMLELALGDDVTGGAKEAVPLTARLYKRTGVLRLPLLLRPAGSSATSSSGVEAAGGPVVVNVYSTSAESSSSEAGSSECGGDAVQRLAGLTGMHSSLSEADLHESGGSQASARAMAMLTRLQQQQQQQQQQISASFKQQQDSNQQTATHQQRQQQQGGPTSAVDTIGLEALAAAAQCERCGPLDGGYGPDADSACVAGPGPESSAHFDDSDDDGQPSTSGNGGSAAQKGAAAKHKPNKKKGGRRRR